ncbi:MAG: carboxypeptidase-like regulatory domain-containing protein, partial [Tannerellaceae bacterium]
MKKRNMYYQRISLPLAIGLSLFPAISNANPNQREHQIVISDTKLTQQGQTRNIKGIVTDQQGEPLIGANIIVQGTTNGVITDFDGKFTLDVPEKGILEVSYIGYTTQAIQISRQKEIKIILKEDTKALDEVVVVGYGTTSVRKNSASVASVNTEKIKEVPFSDMASALQGRVPGVIVQQGSAEPGQNGA